MHKFLGEMAWNVGTTLATNALYDVGKSVLTSQESAPKPLSSDTSDQASSEKTSLKSSHENGYSSNEALWMF